MPQDERPTEGGREDGDPFEETTDEALRYVIDRWGYVGDKIVIEGHITEMTTSWTIKQGDWLNAKMTYEPINLKCDLLVYHPQAAIITERGDLGIVAEVFRQFGNMTSRESRRIMLVHQGKEYSEPSQEGTRVEAGERRDTAKDQQSVAF